MCEVASLNLILLFGCVLARAEVSPLPASQGLTSGSYGDQSAFGQFISVPSMPPGEVISFNAASPNGYRVLDAQLSSYSHQFDDKLLFDLANGVPCLDIDGVSHICKRALWGSREVHAFPFRQEIDYSMLTSAPVLDPFS